jgi:hypothetical protein
MFADLNGDGVIDPNDQAYQGYNEAPEIVFGWNVNLGYKNFNLATNWYGASHVAYRTAGAICLMNLAFKYPSSIKEMADGFMILHAA